ncbi:peptidoglycan editing factor PgeF [Clostridiisalibacter paucivorans]|uniref:peptidoglycan editing factor PgeF n=1 Tax=Clostridiisalibacter paucivorans TaxID=408753 RepID=UPI00047C193E|nr:peptidoglycan editing factor PgeF [Clostridiisalibacter paucivorans]
MYDWNFTMWEKENLTYFTIPSFDETNIVKVFFTTRRKGVSKGYYSSLNLGLNTEDTYENINENYNILCNTLKFKKDSLIFSDQVHSDKIYIVDKKSDKDNIKDIDGLITNKKGVTLVTFYADCVPLFFLDKKNEVIALAHAGWRGTVKKIGKKVIEKMVEVYNTDPCDCLIGIGPSIGGCCFEVDEPVVEEFKKGFKDISKFIDKVNDKGYKYTIDLWKINELVLIEAGVPKENITISNICTKCNSELFFSYRGDNGQTGRMAAIMCLR